MTLIYKLDLYITLYLRTKMKFLGQGFQTGLTRTQTDMTERIITPHSRVALLKYFKKSMTDGNK